MTAIGLRDMAVIIELELRPAYTSEEGAWMHNNPLSFEAREWHAERMRWRREVARRRRENPPRWRVERAPDRQGWRLVDRLSGGIAWCESFATAITLVDRVARAIARFELDDDDLDLDG